MQLQHEVLRVLSHELLHRTPFIIQVFDDGVLSVPLCRKVSLLSNSLRGKGGSNEITNMLPLALVSSVYKLQACPGALRYRQRDKG